MTQKNSPAKKQLSGISSLLFSEKKQEKKSNYSEKGWISIKNELPPETIDKISTVECLYGIENHDEIAVVTLQHIHHDISFLGFSRVTHWKYRK